MADRFEFDLVSDRALSSSTKSRRSYSQRNVSSLQHELTKSRKMINVKTSATTATTTTTKMFSRTISFKPMPTTTTTVTSSLANVENTPIKSFSFNVDRTNKLISAEEINEENRVVEETPMKEDDCGQDVLQSDMMAREIQRLSLRLRSSTPFYNVPVIDNQTNKPTTLHLSQVVNRVSRCNYVLRRFVREAQKYSPKLEEVRSASQTIIAKPFSSLQSHEKGRRRLFVDSPQTKNISEQEQQNPITPRKASGVIKQLFSSPSASLKRTLPSPNHSSTNADKRKRLF